MKRIFWISALVLVLAVSALYAQDKEPAAKNEKRIKELIEKLGDQDPGAPNEAIEELLKIGKPVIGSLVKALKHKAGQVRKYAAETLGYMGDKKAVEPLIQLLKDKGIMVRRSAVLALEGIGDNRAVEPLIKALKDKDEGVRILAGNALMEITDKGFGRDYKKWKEWFEKDLKKKVSGLIKKLGSEKYKEREKAHKELIKIGDAATVQLKEALVNLDPEIQKRSKEILHEIRLECKWGLTPSLSKKFPGILDKLESQDAEVRKEIVKKLSKTNDKEASQCLVKLLEDKDIEVRCETVKALGEIKNVTAVKALVKALKNESFYEYHRGDPKGSLKSVWLRIWTIEAVGKIGSESAVQPLIEELKCKHGTIRSTAAKALKRITKKDFEEDYNKWLNWWQKNKNRFTPELKIEELIKKLGSEKFKEREVVQKELVKIGRSAVSQLKKAIKSDDTEVKVRAERILREIYQADPDPVKGLKLTLRANKKVYKKGDKFVLTVEWKNTGKYDVIVQRKFKDHPLLVLDIKGDLAMNTDSSGQFTEEYLKRLTDGPLTLRPGKKVSAKVKGHGWYMASYFNDRGGVDKELRLQFSDDEQVNAFKRGTYTVTATTKLADGIEARSNPVKIEIK